MPRSFGAGAFLLATLLWCVASAAMAEIVYLKNGDVLHGSVVSVSSERITLQTPYGRLNIPKQDIQRIEYEQVESRHETAEAKPPSWPGKETAEAGVPPGRPTRAVLSLDIRGRSFWYAFESPTDNPADLSIRLRLFLGEKEAALLLDTKPDTFDRSTYFNSFTFSPTDSKVERTATGFDCQVVDAGDGRVVLRLELPEKQTDGQYLVRMLYQINEGSRQFPRWIDAASRSFSVQIAGGKESYVVLEQDASGLDYSGLFRKSMKNLESFQVRVLSSELKDLSTER